MGWCASSTRNSPVGGPRAFQFRATGGTLTLDPQLGGTSTKVQVVVLPPGLKPCPQGGTVSLSRSASGAYNYAGDDGVNHIDPWLMPDVHIEGSANTIMFSRAGQLNIFSTDHPDSQLRPQFAQTFSFDTWQVTAHVEQASLRAQRPDQDRDQRRRATSRCRPSATMAAAQPPWIKVSFTLCETKLQQASLSFKIPPPGIPVGNSGFGVNLIGGTVTIAPDSTEISLDVDFQTLDQFTVTHGHGTVTINTAGLFSLQAQGKIVGQFNADQLLLQVAWNPLDVLFNGTVSYHSLLSGNLYLHGWIGQGWQHKYKWLKDNNDFHFTGSIEGTVQIPKGELIDKKFFKLPPFDIGLSADVSFGEFCGNSNCSRSGVGRVGGGESLWLRCRRVHRQRRPRSVPRHRQPQVDRSVWRNAEAARRRYCAASHQQHHDDHSWQFAAVSESAVQLTGQQLGRV